MNNSRNLSAIGEDNFQNDTFTVARLIVDTFILVFSLFGNILIVISVWKMAKLRKVFTSVLIIQLAICDIFLVSIGITPHMFYIYDYSTYNHGALGCKLLSPLATYQMNAISLIMVLISIERYITIKYNVRSSAGTFKKVSVTVFVHLFALGTVLPYIMTSSLVSYPNGTKQCLESWGTEAAMNYTIFLFLVQIGIPLPVMAVLYLLSWRTIQKRNAKTIKFMDNINVKAAPNLLKYLCCVKFNLSFRQCRDNRKELKRRLSIASEVSLVRRKQTKYYLNMFTAVVLLFTLCMLPNQITWFYLTFEPKPLNKYVSIVFLWLTYSNAVLNPWIYAGCNPFFKRAYRNVIKKCVSVFKRESKKQQPRISYRMKRMRTQTTVVHHDFGEMVHEIKTDYTGNGGGNEYLWITPWYTQDSKLQQSQNVMSNSCTKFDVTETNLYDPCHLVYTNDKKLPQIKDISRKFSVDALLDNKRNLRWNSLPWQRKASLSYSMVLSYVDSSMTQDMEDRSKNDSNNNSYDDELSDSGELSATDCSSNDVRLNDVDEIENTTNDSMTVCYGISRKSFDNLSESVC